MTCVRKTYMFVSIHKIKMVLVVGHQCDAYAEVEAMLVNLESGWQSCLTYVIVSVGNLSNDHRLISCYCTSLFHTGKTTEDNDNHFNPFVVKWSIKIYYR